MTLFELVSTWLAGLGSVRDSLSLEVQAGWVLLLLWGGVQAFWYRRARTPRLTVTAPSPAPRRIEAAPPVTVTVSSAIPSSPEDFLRHLGLADEGFATGVQAGVRRVHVHNEGARS